MVEQMREGALTLGSRRHDSVLQPAASRSSRGPRERVTGSRSAVSRPRGPVTRLHSDARRRRRSADEFQLRTAVTRVRPRVSSAALEIDGIRTVAVVVTDLTPRAHRARASRVEPPEGRIPGDAVARAAHAAERDPGLDAHAARRPAHRGRPPARAGAHRAQRARAGAARRTTWWTCRESRPASSASTLEPLPLVPDSRRRARERPARRRRPRASRSRRRGRSATLNVMADATRLQQVFWNLLSNAIKFTPDGGRVDVRAGRQDQSPRGRRYRHRHRARLPATRIRALSAGGQRARTRRYGGLGLGLAIVSDLVGSTAATWRCTADGAASARLRVTLPGRALGALAAPADPSTAGEAASLAGCRVLLLEDHDDSRDLMVLALSGRGATSRRSVRPATRSRRSTACSRR